MLSLNWKSTSVIIFHLNPQPNVTNLESKIFFSFLIFCNFLFIFCFIVFICFQVFVIFIGFLGFYCFFFRLSILPVVLLAYLSREKDILENMTVNKQMLKASKFGCVTKKSCPSHIINTVNIRHNLTDCHRQIFRKYCR